MIEAAMSPIATSPHAVARRKRILVLSEAWPFVADNTRAVEVIVYGMTRLLAAEPDFEVAFACVGLAEAIRSPAAQAGIDELTAMGVRFFPEIRLMNEKPRSFLVRTLENLFGKGDHLIPGLGQEDKIVEACRMANWNPDVVVPTLSEVATAAATRLPWPVYAYYGNPYSKVAIANLRLQWRWENRNRPIWLARHIYGRILLRRVERLHIESMRRLALVGDVAKNDAEFYRDAGINAYYVNNMWPSAGNEDWRRRRDASEQVSPLKIAASIGQVPATGNTFGLWAIGAEILPALYRRIGAGKFELHVYGRGSPREFLRPLLSDPAVKLRGFVDDIDGELYSCPIFLIANNRYNFKVTHTRFLHAWSLGACVVAWRDSTLAMPEIVHDRNVLLADTADELAELIARAAADVGLRRRLGAEGREALRRHFRPETVVADVARRIRSLVP